MDTTPISSVRRKAGRKPILPEPTQIKSYQLYERQARAIEREATRRGVSQATVLREWIDVALSTARDHLRPAATPQTGETGDG